MADSRGLEASVLLSRRAFLGAAAAAGGTMLSGRLVQGAESGSPSAFRFVHMTDIHVQPELRGGEGFRAALAAAHALKPRPEFILTGGDLVFDALDQDEGRAKALFDLFTSICRDSDIPFRHCIGNHDVFGWGHKSKVGRDHPGYGKKMVQERLGLARTSYSFDHKGWHFCAVDDIVPKSGGGYEGAFSEETLDWLGRDLSEAKGRPTVLWAHIPVVSVCAFRDVDASDQPQTFAPRSRVCRNPKPILALLREHRVPLVLAGHLHENETLRYERTTHITQGAVSGAWWNGPRNLSPEGFGVIDVRGDGTFEHRYHEYGWKAG